VVYDILFHATAETLRTIAATPKHLGAEIGFIVLLHTWGQNLQHHPHLHCVVPGGGLSADGERWVACRPGFFLHVRVLSLLFRRFLLHVLPSGFQRIRHYGILANRYRAANLARCRQLLAAPAPAVKLPDAALDYRDRYQQLTGKSLRDCPKCGHGHMICIETFLPGTLPRGPPGACS
jgi:hypothetical protein